MQIQFFQDRGIKKLINNIKKYKYNSIKIKIILK